MGSNQKWVQRTNVEYQQGWNNLLPTGPAWPRDSGTVLQDVVAGQVKIWGGEVEANAALLLQIESDPRAADILLPDWERAFGLPDNCSGSPSDEPTRRTNLVNKMTFIGAQSRAFFLAQAAAAGQTTTIREYSPYQCGISGCGNTSAYTSDGTFRWGLGQVTMRFVWTATVTALTGSFNGTDIFCLFNRWKPAHTAVVFDYSALQEFNFSRTWNSGLAALM